MPSDNSAVPPLLAAKLSEAALMVESRGWTWTPQSTLADAERLADETQVPAYCELLADAEEAEDIDGGQRPKAA